MTRYWRANDQRSRGQAGIQLKLWAAARRVGAPVVIWLGF
jgi:hypothetical protein